MYGINLSKLILSNEGYHEGKDRMHIQYYVSSHKVNYMGIYMVYFQWYFVSQFHLLASIAIYICQLDLEFDEMDIAEPSACRNLFQDPADILRS
jgi:hypothetical protein